LANFSSLHFPIREYNHKWLKIKLPDLYFSVKKTIQYPMAGRYRKICGFFSK